MKTKLLKLHKEILDKFFLSHTLDSVVAYESLPETLRAKLEKIRFYPYLCKDVERYLEAKVYHRDNKRKYEELHKFLEREISCCTT